MLSLTLRSVYFTSILRGKEGGMTEDEIRAETKCIAAIFEVKFDIIGSSSAFGATALRG